MRFGGFNPTPVHELPMRERQDVLLLVREAELIQRELGFDGMVRYFHWQIDRAHAGAHEHMRGVWTAIIVDQTGGVHTAPAPDPEPYHRIMVVRALLDADHVDEIQNQQVLYEAQGWKDPAVEWAEAQAVAAALNKVQEAR